MGIVVPSIHRRLSKGTLATVLRADVAGRCDIDLQHATFVEPAGLVAVAAMAERAVREGRPVDVTLPADQNCRRYLARMQLGPQLDRLGVAHALEPVRAQPLDSLCELRQFRSETELAEVADVIVTQYRQAGQAVFQPLYNALFELAINAVEHSGEGGGFVALQAFPARGDVAFAVADSGVGLQMRLPDADSDAQAIVLAARKYVSSKAESGRGRGITGVIELTNKHRGAVSFLTGTAQGDFTDGQWEPRVSVLEAPWMGTLVNTRLSQRGE